MINLTGRSLLRGSVAAAAASTLVRPYIANAAAKTATAWLVQGFAQEEDVAMKKIIADYEKASGEGYRHQGRQAASRRSAGQRRGNQSVNLSDNRLQAGLCAGGGDQLERRR
jgi:hypothetical protein